MTDLVQLLQRGLAFHRANRFAEAEALYRQVLAVDSRQFDALNLLGAIATDTGRPEMGVELARAAIAVNGTIALAHYYLGIAYLRLAQVEPSIAALERAIELQPAYPEALTYLGVVYQFANRHRDAVDVARRSLALRPDLVETHKCLASAHYGLGEHDAAVAACKEALAILERVAPGQSPPIAAEIHNSLACVLKDQGLADEAVAGYRRALEIRPNYPVCHGNLLYALHFQNAVTPEMILAEHQRWNELYGAEISRGVMPNGNDPSPERRIRVGYVSPDFRIHPVGRFMATLLAKHDHARFEVFCYSNVIRPDRLTERIRPLADIWRVINGMPNPQFAELVRQDQVDILVDLTMHLEKGRLLAFAAKPAPIQVTYLAYSSTTGLTTMDYRLSDPHLDPPGSDGLYTEKTVRLPETYWCYEPPTEAPGVIELPAKSAGRITFGCLNNFSKVTPETLECWATLLAEVPESRLILSCPEGSTCERIVATFGRKNVSAERLEFMSRMAFERYMALYQRIDIVLDPFPYAGGTTSCDALYMGVPVVTLAGRTAVSRGGASLLANLGLSELIARTQEEYVQITVKLAGDIAKLGELRRDLRGRMERSPLMDAQRFATHLEGAYREMWRHWCQASSAVTKK